MEARKESGSFKRGEMSLVRKDRHGDLGVGHGVGAAILRGRAHGHPDNPTLPAGQRPGAGAGAAQLPTWPTRART